MNIDLIVPVAAVFSPGSPSHHASRQQLMTRWSEFDELGDAEKVKYCETEVAATLGRLDDMIARLAALRTEVDDPDGLVRFTLSDDGRLLTLYIDDAVASSLTRLALENKLNDTIAAGNEVMRLSRKEFWDGAG
jgi:hypothetical protein